MRLSDRQLRVLKARAQREGVALSEALRRCVDEWATAPGRAAPKEPRPRRRTKAAPAPPGEIDLATFARTVREIARSIGAEPTANGLARGRFGPQKVFLAAVRRQFRAHPQLARFPRAVVDDLLLHAHRAGLLELVRADLVSAMDPAEVRDSEIESPTGARFHFVVDE